MMMAGQPTTIHVSPKQKLTRVVVKVVEGNGRDHVTMIDVMPNRDHFYYLLWGMKHYKCMGNLKDFHRFPLLMVHSLGWK